MDREQLTLRIPEELKEALQKEALEKGLSLNALISLIVAQRIGQFYRENLRPLTTPEMKSESTTLRH